MELYYIIIAFGALMMVFVSLTLSRAKQVVSPYASAKRSGWRNFLQGFKEFAVRWYGYFTANNPKNLVRNVLIVAVISAVLFVLNREFLQIETIYFVPILLGLIFMVVSMLGKRRNRKIFDDAFPEVIQIVNSATSAGIGLMQALERCGSTIFGPFGVEYKNIHRRLSIGEDADSVFQDSYSRYPYKEYYYFIAIIKLNLSRGGQMKEVISRLSKMIADSKKMDKRKKALTSEARMSAMIVACFPIGFMLFMRIMMPADFDFLINDPRGRVVFYYVLGSESLGLFIIWMLMRKTS